MYSLLSSLLALCVLYFRFSPTVPEPLSAQPYPDNSNSDQTTEAETSQNEDSPGDLSLEVDRPPFLILRQDLQQSAPGESSNAGCQTGSEKPRSSKRKKTRNLNSDSAQAETRKKARVNERLSTESEDLACVSAAALVDSVPGRTQSRLSRRSDNCFKPTCTGCNGGK
jgi:hypothetical protein